MEVNWDQLIQNKFLENISAGTVCCDVGACNGVFTNFFKNITGDKGTVYSFELNIFNYENLLRLSSYNCICENLAISDKEEILDVYSDNELSGNHISNIIGHDTSFRKMESVGKVKSTSLDIYFKNKNVDYIKIDGEGAELKVIKGGVETLKKCKLAIIECHFDEDWKEICQVINDNNLKFKNLVNDEFVDYGSYQQIPGRSSIGRPYQMYLTN